MRGWHLFWVGRTPGWSVLAVWALILPATLFTWDVSVPLFDVAVPEHGLARVAVPFLVVWCFVGCTLTAWGLCSQAPDWEAGGVGRVRVRGSLVVLAVLLTQSVWGAFWARVALALPHHWMPPGANGTRIGDVFPAGHVPPVDGFASLGVTLVGSLVFFSVGAYGKTAGFFVSFLGSGILVCGTGTGWCVADPYGWCLAATHQPDHPRWWAIAAGACLACLALLTWRSTGGLARLGWGRLRASVIRTVRLGSRPHGIPYSSARRPLT